MNREIAKKSAVNREIAKLSVVNRELEVPWAGLFKIFITFPTGPKRFLRIIFPKWLILSITKRVFSIVDVYRCSLISYKGTSKTGFVCVCGLRPLKFYIHPYLLSLIHI